MQNKILTLIVLFFITFMFGAILVYSRYYLYMNQKNIEIHTTGQVIDTSKYNIPGGSGGEGYFVSGAGGGGNGICESILNSNGMYTVVCKDHIEIMNRK